MHDLLAQQGIDAPFKRVPVRARYMPMCPGSWFRKWAAPTSGYRPMPHSGMANSVLHKMASMSENEPSPALICHTHCIESGALWRKWLDHAKSFAKP